MSCLKTNTSIAVAILGPILLTSLLGVCSAQSPASAIFLKDGKVIHGQIIKEEVDRAITVRPADGGAPVRLTYSKLAPRTIYRLKRARTPPGNASQQLELADYARHHHLYAAAAEHYKQALKDNPRLEQDVDQELGLLRIYASQRMLREAKEQMAKKNYKAAEKILTTQLKEFPHEDEAHTARAILMEIEAKRPKDAVSPVLNAVVMGSEVQDEFEQAQHHLEAARAMSHRALLSTKHQDQCIGFFNRALSDGEAARRALAPAQRHAVANSAVAAKVAALSKTIVGEMVDDYLHLASVYANRTSFQQALAEVNKALALDPGNKDALAMRSQVQDASASGGDWGWGGRRGWGRYGRARGGRGGGRGGRR